MGGHESRIRPQSRRASTTPHPYAPSAKGGQASSLLASGEGGGYRENCPFKMEENFFSYAVFLPNGLIWRRTLMMGGTCSMTKSISSSVVYLLRLKRIEPWAAV